MKIALTGYARSGKDTVATMMRNKLGRLDTARMAFGYELRIMFHDLFPNIPREPKPRDAYGQFGQGMREIDQDVWVNKLANTYGMLQRFQFENYIITDLRQPNELEWAKENGFKIVFVHAYSSIRRKRSQDDAEYNDINSAEESLSLIEPDHHLWNMGDMEYLEGQVEKVLALLREESQ